MRSILFGIFFLGSVAFADTCKYVDTQEFSDIPNVGYVKVARTQNDCEIQSELFVNAGTQVQWYKNGQILGTKLAKEAVIEGRYAVTGGANIYWYDNGKLYYLDHFSKDTELAPGIWTKKASIHGFWSGAVNWDRTGRVTWIEVLAKPLLNSDGKILAQECESVKFPTDGSVIPGDLYYCRAE